MNTKLLLVGVLVAFGWSSHASAQTTNPPCNVATPDNDFCVRGNLYDNSDHTLAGKTVYLCTEGFEGSYNGCGSVIVSVQTDANGGFYFQPGVSGSYDVCPYRLSGETGADNGCFPYANGFTVTNEEFYQETGWNPTGTGWGTQVTILYHP